MKSLHDFASDTLGGSYGNPGTNTYVGQCVSYVRLYMEQVLGIKTAVWGNAVDYWTNPSVLKHFDKVSKPKDGDIVVWGDDAGNWTTQYGHIAIWYQGQILNQNYGGSLRVSVNPMFYPGLLGYLRPKKAKEEEMTTAERAIYNKGNVVAAVRPLKEGNIIFEFKSAGNQWKLDTLATGKAASSARVKKGHRITCHAFADLNYSGKKHRYYMTETDLKAGRLYGVNALDVIKIAEYKG